MKSQNQESVIITSTNGIFMPTCVYDATKQLTDIDYKAHHYDWAGVRGKKIIYFAHIK